MLRKVWEEDRKVAKPILDQQQWDEIEQTILLVMEFAIPVRVKIWNEGYFLEPSGMIHHMDELIKILFLETKGGKMINFSFSYIREAFADNT